MSNESIMNILLVEDDKKECERFKNYINTLNNVKLVGVVNSCEEALKHITTYLPETIILDIELNEGEGSGIDLLDKINRMRLDFSPIIGVITNIFAKELHDYLHINGAHFVFYKQKIDYSPELVVGNLHKIWMSAVKLHKNEKTVELTTETISEKIERIIKKLDYELDCICMGRHLNGRKYIKEAILYLLNIENRDNTENVFNYLGKKYKTISNSILRSIQVAVESAWRSAPIEDLQKHYTQNFNYNRGNPTGAEFVYYYADILKKFI